MTVRHRVSAGRKQGMRVGYSSVMAEQYHRDVMGKYAPRYAQKPDSNQPEIVAGLEKMGCSVYDAHRVGEIPDIIVGYRGWNTLMEIKILGAKLKQSQKDWHRDWRGHSCVVHSLEEAIEVVLANV
jgi:hypothetical protein